MKCVYPHYSHLRKGEKTKFTLSLVKTLRRDKIQYQRCITGSNELDEMSDDELCIRLSQALREQWVKEPAEVMMKSYPFRNFFLQQEHGHINNEDNATSQDGDLSSTKSEFEVKDEDEMFPIEDDFSDIEPLPLDGPLITPHEIQELRDSFRGKPKATVQCYRMTNCMIIFVSIHDLVPSPFIVFSRVYFFI